MTDTATLPEIQPELLDTARVARESIQAVVPAASIGVPAAIELAKIDLTAVALAQYGDWRKDVAATKASLSTLVLDLSTPTKIKEARSLRARMIGEPLANVRKVAAGIKSKMARTSKALGAELEQIEAAYSEADALILPQIEKREAELERERAERERIEAERRAKHQSAIATIRNYIALAKGLPSERIAKGLNVVEALDVSPAVFEEFAEDAARAKAEVFERLTEMHQAAVQAEENARLQAELAKARAEQAARERAEREAEDALIASFFHNSRRIEADTVAYIQKAINTFAPIARDFANDSRPRVAQALAEAQQYMARRLSDAQEREAAAKAAAEQNTPQQGANRDASAGQSHVAEGSASPAGRGDNVPTACGAAPVISSPAAATMVTLQPGAAPRIEMIEPDPKPSRFDDSDTMEILGAKCLTTGAINKRIGATFNVEFITDTLGIEPHGKVKAATYWRASSFSAICRAASDYFAGLAE